ncbi:MAG: PepSY domain-containing protein, partial [Rhodoferax sp.]|nr:PepSY domain-containing protein [Rhodoferax sp.]
PHSYVYVDQYSGQIVGMQNRQHFGTANQINNWLHPLHDASIGGLGLRLAVAFAGLVPMALFITGWMRWLARRRARVLDESARQR